MLSLRVLIILFLVIILRAQNVFSGEELKLLGAGTIVSTSPYRGVSSRVTPIPVDVWSYKDFYIRGLETGYRFYDRSPFVLRVLGAPRLMGYSSGDSSVLSAMADRESSFDVGLGADYALPFGRDYFLEGKVVTDVSGRHDGQEVEAAFVKKVKSSLGRLTCAAGVRLQTAAMTDYYYGVRWDEARADRPEYEAGSVVNYMAHVVFVRGISRNWVVLTRLSGELLGDAARKSPIVDEAVVFSGMLGVARRF